MPSLKTILCALDLSEHSQVVAEEASMLAKLSGAKIYAMYVAPTMTQYTGFHVAPSTIDGFVGEIVTGAENSMAEFVAKHFEGVEVEADVLAHVGVGAGDVDLGHAQTDGGAALLLCGPLLVGGRLHRRIVLQRDRQRLLEG